MQSENILDWLPSATQCVLAVGCDGAPYARTAAFVPVFPSSLAGGYIISAWSPGNSLINQERVGAKANYRLYISPIGTVLRLLHPVQAVKLENRRAVQVTARLMVVCRYNHRKKWGVALCKRIKVSGAPGGFRRIGSRDLRTRGGSCASEQSYRVCC